MEQLTTKKDIEIVFEFLPVSTLLAIYNDISVYYKVFEKDSREFEAIDNISTDLLTTAGKKIEVLKEKTDGNIHVSDLC